MKTLLKTWSGTIQYNGNEYDTFNSFNSAEINKNNAFDVVLYPKDKKSVKNGNNSVLQQDNTSNEVVVTVKMYMTKKASPEFDFMAKWNNDVPMPLRTMVGHRVKETPGMVYMELHGDIIQEKTVTCMCCGKKLTNPVSQYFGIGPECGHHNYVNPFNTDEELREAVKEYRRKLQDVKWAGWCIKSAIISEEPYCG